MAGRAWASSADPERAAGTAFAVNAPGRLARKSRWVMSPGASYAPNRPLRLGHILAFSTTFRQASPSLRMRWAWGWPIARRTSSPSAARRNSDHHLFAFAKSEGVGFHHASFRVADPDEVGRGGRALVEKSGCRDWRFGRHTIGSDFFHYIHAPWRSRFEYYSDTNHVEDCSLWMPTNYTMADGLANWGPVLPVSSNPKIAEITTALRQRRAIAGHCANGLLVLP